MMQLTEAEIAFLIKQPDVANTLARFNRSQAYQSTDDHRRMDHVKRAREFERLERQR